MRNYCTATGRGDTFPAFPEDEENSTAVTPSLGTENRRPKPLLSSLPLSLTQLPTVPPTPDPDPDPDAETCSGRPFDSFMQLKNGSVYAFRGEEHTQNIPPETGFVVAAIVVDCQK